MTVRSDGSVVNNNARPSSRSNAPLSLNPNAPAEPQDAGEPVSQPGPRSSLPSGTQAYASVEPPARVQQSSYAPAGSYVVQVSSQKTEADAHTAWRQLQSRYTNVLSDAQVTFKRVDLGDRGTFYRAMVGPYANRDQAYEMCQNLKAAGGECVVQRN
jgi:cell division septation protein DedD